jgi:hypothetical protein
VLLNVNKVALLPLLHAPMQYPLMKCAQLFFRDGSIIKAKVFAN